MPYEEILTKSTGVSVKENQGLTDAQKKNARYNIDSDNLIIVSRGDTTHNIYEEVKSAIEKGKTVLCREVSGNNTTYSYFRSINTTLSIVEFYRATDDGVMVVRLSSEHEWSTEQYKFAEEVHTHSAASTTANGFMSSSDKTKLDGIEAGAKDNIFVAKFGETTYESIRTALDSNKYVICKRVVNNIPQFYNLLINNGSSSIISFFKSDTNIIYTISVTSSNNWVESKQKLAPLSNDTTLTALDDGKILVYSDADGGFILDDANAHSHTKSQITDFPTSMTPKSHKSSHTTGGTDAIAPADIGAAASSHSHAQSDITNLTTDLGNKQPKITASGLLKGDGSGGIAAAVAGKDYVTPSDSTKVVTGSYIGTGTYTWSNANSITFPFVPKWVLIHKKSSTSIWYGLIMSYQSNGGTILHSNNSPSTYEDITVSWSDNSVTWYNDKSADRQMNQSGWEYNYIAIG